MGKYDYMTSSNAAGIFQFIPSELSVRYLPQNTESLLIVDRQEINSSKNPK